MSITLNSFRNKILSCLKWNNGYNRIRVSACELYKLSYDIWWLILTTTGQWYCLGTWDRNIIVLVVPVLAWSSG